MQDSNIYKLEDFKVFEVKMKVHADVNGMHINSIQFCNDFNNLNALAKSDLYNDIVSAVSEKQSEQLQDWCEELQDNE
jgi:hypothetical protein